MVSKVISGGQTGVDRAALDVALQLGISCGGWCPHGRKAEDGIIPDLYPLQQTSSSDYAERTARNVLEANATLVITRGALSGGTALTVQVARRSGKPYQIVDLSRTSDPGVVRNWLEQSHIAILNIAGPRESGCPGIYDEARRFLLGLLRQTERLASSRRRESRESQPGTGRPRNDRSPGIKS